MAIIRNDDVMLRLIYFAIGFSPITALSMSVFGFVPLHRSAPCLVAPAIVVGVVLGCKRIEYGRLAARGALSGLVAVTVYDLSRFAIIALGGWTDFIPKIGDWLLAREHVHWSVGYLWRYAGNGAGMGLAYVMVVKFIDPYGRRVLFGIGYGVLIWICLLITLLASPSGETMMFHLSLATFLASLVGHIVYGGMLGIINERYIARYNRSLSTTVPYYQSSPSSDTTRR